MNNQPKEIKISNTFSIEYEGRHLLVCVDITEMESPDYKLEKKIVKLCQRFNGKSWTDERFEGLEIHRFTDDHLDAVIQLFKKSFESQIDLLNQFKQYVEANRPIRYACRDCGSTDIGRDAWAEWDEELQMWVVENHLFEDKNHCFVCDGPTKLVENVIPIGA